MNILLDKQIIIWFIKGEEKLSSRVKEIIEDQENELYVSIISLWEIVIKTNAGKLDVKKSIRDVVEYLDHNNIGILNISLLDLEQQRKLKMHHSDPFDHLIISQAINNNLTVISSDRYFPAYPIAVIW